MKISVSHVLAFAVCVALAAPAWAVTPNLAMGNPSDATADAANRSNFLMDRQYFALSYNDGKGIPNWVAWRLVPEDIGHAPRVKFHPDMDLPEDYKHVETSDYTSQGFDRGHMCDHGDRSSTLEASTATFAMTNIVPQSAELNRKAWAHLEAYCRELVGQGKTLYIYSGPLGQGGSGSEGDATVIGEKHQIAVPAKCWKVIMVLDRAGRDPEADIAQVTTATRMIAVVMPNDRSVGEPWAGFRTSVAEVEKLTGFTFYKNVPAAVMGPLKKQVDSQFVPVPVPFRDWNSISH